MQLFISDAHEGLKDALHRVFGGASWQQAAAVMGDARDDVLAYRGFPAEHWTRIYSTNPLERLNKEVKRRSNVVGVFPDVPSVMRLVGAVLVEIDDD